MIEDVPALCFTPIRFFSLAAERSPRQALAGTPCSRKMSVSPWVGYGLRLPLQILQVDSAFGFTISIEGVLQEKETAAEVIL